MHVYTLFKKRKSPYFFLPLTFYLEIILGLWKSYMNSAKTSMCVSLRMLTFHCSHRIHNVIGEDRHFYLHCTYEEAEPQRG